jgi:hypothetical protein
MPQYNNPKTLLHPPKKAYEMNICPRNSHMDNPTIRRYKGITQHTKARINLLE